MLLSRRAFLTTKLLTELLRDAGLSPEGISSTEPKGGHAMRYLPPNLDRLIPSRHHGVVTLRKRRRRLSGEHVLRHIPDTLPRHRLPLDPPARL